MPSQAYCAEMARRAYCAGIIDGEGYISANRLKPTAANKKSTPKYVLRLSLTMADEAPVKFVAGLIGLEFKVYLRDRKAKANHSKMYVLDLQADNAVKLTKMVLPFLINKKRQAELLCEFHELKSTSSQHVTKVVWRAGAGRNYREHSDSYIADCDRLYLAMRRRRISNNGVEARAL